MQVIAFTQDLFKGRGAARGKTVPIARGGRVMTGSLLVHNLGFIRAQNKNNRLNI